MRLILLQLSFICVCLFIQVAGRCHGINEINFEQAKNTDNFSAAAMPGFGEIALTACHAFSGNIQNIHENKGPDDAHFQQKQAAFTANNIAYAKPANLKPVHSQFLLLIFPSHYFW